MEKQRISVGILSYNPLETLEGSRWKLSFKRLNSHPDYIFIPQFLDIEALQKKLNKDELDFVIIDAFSYLKLEEEYGIQHMLTRNELYSKKPFSLEGLSLYTKSNNYNIVRFLDLKDKKIAVLAGNIPISKTFLKQFLFKHGLIIDFNINIEIINEVNQLLNLLDSTKVDAIIAKSGVIEKKFKKQYVLNKMPLPRLINPRQSWQAPFLHSSELIPEWPIAKAWFIENSLANQVASLLLSSPKLMDGQLINVNHGEYNINESADDFLEQYQWSIAQDYNILYTLFSLTKNNQALSQNDHAHLSSQFQTIVVYIIIFFLLVILSLFLRSSRDLNNRLTLSKQSLEREINERQLAQEQALSHHDELAHVTRLSTMGEMASGLAHELNQPLSAIHTYVQGCIRRIDTGQDNLEEIVNALKLTTQQADRAAGIIRRLRSFVRKEQTHKTYSDINNIIHEVLSFLDSQLKNNNIKIRLQLQDKLAPVLVDIIQIEQVLVNLLKNASESLINVNGPGITISTKLVRDDAIELCIIDNGHGISKDKLKRIFNPFFTTKNSGLGMGLSISKSIIEAHDGKLYATNNTIQGARFCLTLPLISQNNVLEGRSGNNNE
ncbi:MAG: PhnD/SsuA/transferrin family substrate-binding protein [gamma proteobacterium symbiont of Taylorina sp.]|nr:PhnD/SsuA/transferrin family substrate-binding protein [gamma proteobacterium symbiont of Taylorina sp.]